MFDWPLWNAGSYYQWNCWLDKRSNGGSEEGMESWGSLCRGQHSQSNTYLSIVDGFSWEHSDWWTRLHCEPHFIPRQTTIEFHNRYADTRLLSTFLQLHINDMFYASCYRAYIMPRHTRGIEGANSVVSVVAHVLVARKSAIETRMPRITELTLKSRTRALL